MKNVFSLLCVPSKERNEFFMKNKKLFFIIFTIFLFIIILFSFTNCSYGADQKLVNTMNKAFEQIESWLLKLATPAAAVSVRCWCFYEEV